MTALFCQYVGGDLGYYSVGYSTADDNPHIADWEELHRDETPFHLARAVPTGKNVDVEQLLMSLLDIALGRCAQKYGFTYTTIRPVVLGVLGTVEKLGPIMALVWESGKTTIASTMVFPTFTSEIEREMPCHT